MNFKNFSKFNKSPCLLDRTVDRLFSQVRAKTFRDLTTAKVTYTVIGLLAAIVFVVWIAVMFSASSVTETFKDGELVKRVTPNLEGNPFIDLLSNLALIIAAAFTTVIGYYFGNRTTEGQAQAVEQAVEQAAGEVIAESAAENVTLQKENKALRAQVEGTRDMHP